ncbi:MAG: D-alanyl-D-alanine carboxypeptidase/D-alanyl-D-alanine endopeptidase [Verrucomicrobiales bacterium]
MHTPTDRESSICSAAATAAAALIFLLTSTPPVLAAEPGAQNAALQSAVEALAGSPSMRSGILGVAVLPLAGGGIVYDHEGEKSLVPASAMKVITTASAIHYLGPDYRFKTTLQLDDEGNVIIRGSGDPSLAEYSSDTVFASFAAKLKEAGITRLAGAVVGDASAFGTQLVPDTWQYYDMGNYFGAGASGLSFRRNSYRAYFAPGKKSGEVARFLRTSPVVPGLKFTNEMLTGTSRSGDRGFIYIVPYGDHAFLRGTIPAGGKSFSIRGSMPDPALTCAQYFQEFVEGQGIAVAKPATTVRRIRSAGGALPATRRDLHAHLSEPLSKLALDTNHRSINLHAECLLRAVALEESGTGSIRAGIEASRRMIASYGISTAGLHIADGSGLSRLNGVTPRQFAYLLKSISESEHGDVFLRTLPVAGKSGTLKYIGGGTPAAGRIQAKSGTLERIKCYVGYVDSLSGRRYAFAIMANNFVGDYYPVRKGIERIMTALARF